MHAAAGNTSWCRSIHTYKKNVLCVLVDRIAMLFCTDNMRRAMNAASLSYLWRFVKYPETDYRGSVNHLQRLFYWFCSIDTNIDGNYDDQQFLSFQKSWSNCSECLMHTCKHSSKSSTHSLTTIQEVVRHFILYFPTKIHTIYTNWGKTQQIYLHKIIKIIVFK